MAPEELAEDWREERHVEDPFTDDSGIAAPLFKLRFEDGPIKGELSISSFKRENRRSRGSRAQ